MLFGVGHVGRQMIAGNPVVGGATLDLGFMVPGSLDPRVTFTRAAGPATYFDSSGVMRTAAVNLWLQSADASNAAWTKGGATAPAPVVTANQTTAPDGTLTAASVAYPAVNIGGAFSVLYQSLTVTAAAYAFSVWLKGAVGGEQVSLGTNVAAASYSSVKVTLTTQWQRFTLITPTLTAAAWIFDIGTDLRDGTQTNTPAQTIYVWGGQVELGSSASPYIPTTTAPNGAPRWDYDPVTLALKGLLIEEARTNTLLNSNTLNPTSGCVASTDVPVLFAAATQWKYTVVAAGGNGPIWAINAPSAASTTFAVSCWVYIPAAYSTAVDGMPRLDIDNSGLGTGGSQSAAAIADATKRNQWQRLVSTISFGTSPGSIFNVLIRNNAPTNGGSIFYCTCPQIEVGAFATSYIPTTAAAVTRAVEQGNVPVGAWYNAAASAMSVDAILPAPAASVFYQAMTSIDDGTTNQRAQIFRGAGLDAIYAQANSYNINVGSMTAGQPFKAALSWRNGAQGSALNGVLGLPDVFGSMPTGVTTLRLGYTANGLGMSGYLRRVQYWPRVLSNAELQQVTR